MPDTILRRLFVWRHPLRVFDGTLGDHSVSLS